MPATSNNSTTPAVDDDAVESFWRITERNGRVTYHVLYQDGEVKKVAPKDILDVVGAERLARYEHENFRRNDNAETIYFAEDDMGGWSRGTPGSVLKSMARQVREVRRRNQESVGPGARMRTLLAEEEGEERGVSTESDVPVWNPSTFTRKKSIGGNEEILSSSPVRGRPPRRRMRPLPEDIPAEEGDQDEEQLDEEDRATDEELLDEEPMEGEPIEGEPMDEEPVLRGEPLENRHSPAISTKTDDSEEAFMALESLNNDPTFPGSTKASKMVSVLIPPKASTLDMQTDSEVPELTTSSPPSRHRSHSTEPEGERRASENDETISIPKKISPFRFFKQRRTSTDSPAPGDSTTSEDVPLHMPMYRAPSPRLNGAATPSPYPLSEPATEPNDGPAPATPKTPRTSISVLVISPKQPFPPPPIEASDSSSSEKFQTASPGPEPPTLSPVEDNKGVTAVEQTNNIEAEELGNGVTHEPDQDSVPPEEVTDESKSIPRKRFRSIGTMRSHSPPSKTPRTGSPISTVAPSRDSRQSSMSSTRKRPKRKFFSTRKRVARPKQPPQEWEVERVIEHAVIDGVKHYCVKWVGFPESQNTWEPEENLAGSIELVQEYNERLGDP